MVCVLPIQNTENLKKTVLFIVIIAKLFLQSSDVVGKKKDPPIDFWSIEESVLRLLSEINETRDDSLAVQKHLQIEEILAQSLVFPTAYKHKFDSLKSIGKLYAPRKAFRVFNWNHSFRDGTHRHFALIVIPGKKKEPNQVIRLVDTSDSIVKPEQQTLGPDQWFGVLYYKIISKRKAKDKKQHYTLLGLDMNNLKTKKKIIEVLTFDKNGEPIFGAPIIEMNKRTKKRVIFEFAAQQSMYLEYNWFKRRIEFDHLSPLMPYLVGEYEYYEPDLFRDGFKFKNGQWKHKKDIEKRPKDKKVKKRSLPKPPRTKVIKEKQAKPVEETTPEETENTEKSE